MLAIADIREAASVLIKTETDDAGGVLFSSSDSIPSISPAVEALPLPSLQPPPAHGSSPDSCPENDFRVIADNKPDGDNSGIYMNAFTMGRLGVACGDLLLVSASPLHGKQDVLVNSSPPHGKQDVLVVTLDAACSDATVKANGCSRSNTGIKLGHSVNIRKAHGVSGATKVFFLPFSDDADILDVTSCSDLVTTWLTPYFSQRCRPITSGNTYILRHGALAVEFKVECVHVRGQPALHATVGQDTEITCCRFDASMSPPRWVGGEPVIREDCERAVRCLLKLVTCSSDKMSVQSAALAACRALLGTAAGQQPRAQAAVNYLVNLAQSSSDNCTLQTAVLRALESIVTGHTANQAAAGPDAACFLLQLANSSSGGPTLQIAALHAFTAVVSRHKLNKEAAGPRAVQLLLPLLQSPSDNDSCAAVYRAALDALYAVVVNVPGNQSAAGARCGSHTSLGFVL